jgi:hypothetical protein
VLCLTVLDRGSVKATLETLAECGSVKATLETLAECYVEVGPMVAPEPDGKRRQQDAAAQPGEGAALTVMCGSVFVLWGAMAVCWPVGYLLCLNTAVIVLEYDHCA